MAAGTFTVAGQRVRSASTRRFVVFIVTRERPSGIVSRVEIHKRSDSVAKAKEHARRHATVIGAERSWSPVIIDTADGSEVSF